MSDPVGHAINERLNLHIYAKELSFSNGLVV